MKIFSIIIYVLLWMMLLSSTGMAKIISGSDVFVGDGILIFSDKILLVRGQHTFILKNQKRQGLYPKNHNITYASKHMIVIDSTAYKIKDDYLSAVKYEGFNAVANAGVNSTITHITDKFIIKGPFAYLVEGDKAVKVKDQQGVQLRLNTEKIPILYASHRLIVTSKGTYMIVNGALSPVRTIKSNSMFLPGPIVELTDGLGITNNKLYALSQPHALAIKYQYGRPVILTKNSHSRLLNNWAILGETAYAIEDDVAYEMKSPFKGEPLTGHFTHVGDDFFIHENVPYVKDISQAVAIRASDGQWMRIGPKETINYASSNMIIIDNTAFSFEKSYREVPANQRGLHTGGYVKVLVQVNQRPIMSPSKDHPLQLGQLEIVTTLELLNKGCGDVIQSVLGKRIRH